MNVYTGKSVAVNDGRYFSLAWLTNRETGRDGVNALRALSIKPLPKDEFGFFEAAPAGVDGGAVVVPPVDVGVFDVNAPRALSNKLLPKDGFFWAFEAPAGVGAVGVPPAGVCAVGNIIN